MVDVWKPVHQPTRRELEQRKAAEEARRAQPRPVEGKPGFSIDKDGRWSYDPDKDPQKRAYKAP